MELQNRHCNCSIVDFGTYFDVLKSAFSPIETGDSGPLFFSTLRVCYSGNPRDVACLHSNGSGMVSKLFVFWCDWSCISNDLCNSMGSFLFSVFSFLFAFSHLQGTIPSWQLYANAQRLDWCQQECSLEGCLSLRSSMSLSVFFWCGEEEIISSFALVFLCHLLPPFWKTSS